jgi:hypothetical protein
MKTAKKNNGRIALLVALLTSAAVLTASPAAASAAAPSFQLDVAADTTVAPGGTLHYFIRAINVGDGNGEPFTLTIRLPEGMTSAGITNRNNVTNDPYEPCSGATGAAVVTCTTPLLFAPSIFAATDLQVDVAPDAEGTLITEVEFSGGGGQPQVRKDATRIAASPPAYGVDSFDGSVDADANGTAFTRAAGHPYSNLTSIAFNTERNPNPLIGDLWPISQPRDVAVELPPGFIGSPAAAAQCTAGQLANSITATDVRPLCPPASQVGLTTITVSKPSNVDKVEGPLPVFNMVPPPGVPARFGFNVDGTVVVLDARVRSGSDYGVTVDARNISEGLALAASDLTFWGVPADSSHDPLRACPGEHAPSLGGQPCHAEVAPRAFLRNPTSCTAPAGSPVPDALVTTIHTDSWADPGARDAEGHPDLSDPAWRSDQFLSHLPPGKPAPGPDQLPTDCGEVPFTPSITVQPTTNKADSPTGLDVDLTMPQGCWDAKATLAEVEAALCQADVKDSFVTQPVGTRVNPAAAAGLTGCSEAQIGYLGAGPMPNPTRFTGAAPTCPDSSKIGTVEIESPLIEHTLTGAIYQARQDENPFGATLAFYTVADADGVMIKLPAEVRTDPNTGQVTTIFRNSPQLPFSHYRLHFFGGAHAPLITPPTCGIKATRSTFTGWANPEAPAHLTDYFEITEGANGAPCPNGDRERPFAPRFEAGTVNPLAGAFSPFVLKVSREDGEQELSGLETTLPPGLIGRLAGIPYCPEAAIQAAGLARGVFEQAAPSCPAASQVGVSDASAGAGPEPFHNPGKAYLAGPYKGAPLSLAILTPAVAGPLDLGTVVVRAALHVDPETTQIHVTSDPIPSVLREGGNGFPLDLRQVLVQMNRPDFTLNPTNCDPMSVDGTISSTLGTSAAVSNRFQVGNCDRLGFKPKLSLRLKGKTNRGGNPALRATLKMPSGGANIARASVALPHSEFLDNAHIKTICTRVQYAEGGGGGAGCPPGSVYGHATAWSPLLDRPLSGPVYLRSSSHKLPDLVASLDGQIHVDLDGTIDSVNGGIRNRFEVVPDAPVSKFVLTMQGGKKGLLENSRNLCASVNRASVRFDAQSGRTADSRPPLKAAGCAKHRKRHGQGHR